MRFKPSIPPSQTQRHKWHFDGGEERHLEESQKSYTHTLVYQPSRSSAEGGGTEHSRRRREKGGRTEDIRGETEETRREHKLDKGAWQGGKRQRESQRVKGKKDRNEEH